MKKICNSIYYGLFTLILLFFIIFTWVNIDGNNTNLLGFFGITLILSGVFFIASPFIVEGIDFAGTRKVLLNIALGIYMCYQGHQLIDNVVYYGYVSGIDHIYIPINVMFVYALVFLVLNFLYIPFYIRKKYFEFYLSFLAFVGFIATSVFQLMVHVDFGGISPVIYKLTFTISTIVLVFSFVLSIIFDRTSQTEEYLPNKRKMSFANKFKK